MKERTILKVPFPSHLINYIYEELQFEDHRIQVRSNGILGAYILNLVEESNSPMVLPQEMEYIEIEIPSQDPTGKRYDGRTKWLVISEVNLKRLHAMIQKLMYQELYGRLNIIKARNEAQRRGGKMTQEIEKFIAKYSDDKVVLSIDAIRRSYLRYCKERERRTGKALK